MTKDSCKAAAPETKWIEADDCTVSAEAQATAKKECSSSEGEEVDRERGREILQDAAEPNIILRNLESAKSKEEFNENLSSDYEAETQGIAMAKGASIIVAFIMLGCFNCLCWTMWPCKCCHKLRCFAKERGDAPKLTKAVVFAIWFGLILGCLISALLAMTGKGNIEKGLDRFVCAGSELASFSLSGKKQDGDAFMGMLPILLYIDEVIGYLKPGGAFNTEVLGLLDLTVGIERSTKMLSATLRLLTDTAGQPENINPKTTGGDTLDHKCIYCEQVGDKIGPVVTELDESLANALADARAKVKDQLSGDKAADLANQLEDNLAPLRKNADLVRDNLGKVSNPDFGDTKEQIKGLISLVITLLTVMVFPLMLCGCLSVTCWAFKERSADVDKNPYNRHVRNASCLGCCYGTFYIALVMIIAGILNTVTQPVASMCLVIADINGENLDKWSPALGIADDESAQQAFDIVDTCFTEQGHGDIFKVLKVKVCPKDADGKRPGKCDEGVKEKMTIREKLEDELQSQINAAFDKVTEKDTGMIKTSEQDGFDKLLKFLDTPLDSLTFFADPEGMAQRPEFAGFLSQDSTVQDIATSGFASHAKCDKFTFDVAEFPEIKEYVEKATSINDFRQKVVSAGYATGSTSNSNNCVDALTCTSSNPLNKAVCDSSNEIIKLKRKLKDSFNYRCDMLYKPCGPGGQQVPGKPGQCWCDPKDMSKQANGEWTEDCLSEDLSSGSGSSFEAKSAEKLCGFDDLVEYIQDFRTRLKNSAGNLDDSVGLVKNKILEGMRGVVNKYVFDTILELIDGINCKYLASGLVKTVDGLCFQTVRGVSEVAHAYTALGSLGVIVVIFLYMMFRRSADNINKWVPPAKEGVQGAVPGAA